MQNEIDLQRTVSQDFSQTRAQVIGSIDRRLDQLKEQRDNGRLSESDYQTQSRQWQQGKVLLNMLAAGLASPADNAGGIAAATASPALSYQIGQYFKANDLKNQADGGQRPGESRPAHLLAHSILGAAVAASGGRDALTGALSAGGAEAAAPVLSRWLYGKAAAELTADEKQTVAGISGLLGAGIGAAAGNSSADTVSGSLSAQSAVEANALDRLDGMAPGERSIRSYAARTYPNNKEKAEIFVKEYESYQTEAAILAGKEIVLGTWETIRHPIDAASGLIDVVSNPRRSYNKIVMTVSEWNRAYDAALQNAPRLAARMKALLDNRISANATAMVIGGGLANSIGNAARAGKLGRIRVAAGTGRHTPHTRMGGKISPSNREAIGGNKPETIIKAHTASNTEIGIQWGRGVNNQGMPCEDHIGKSLPASARLPRNFKTFDYFDERSGLAISAKTVDTQTASRLANPAQIYQTVKGHIDRAANFDRYVLSGVDLRAQIISHREIHLAIPASTSSAQWQQLQRAVEYGNSRNVKVIITEIK